jgi:hypothetical protein
MDFIKTLQNDPVLFNEYKENAFKIKNKKYLNNLNNAVCLIETTNDEFKSKDSSEDYSDIDIDTTVCMID